MNYFRLKFRNLERLEFEGQIDEQSLVSLLLDLADYERLAIIRLVNKGAFFNTKMLLGHEKILEMGVFAQGYEILKVDGGKSRLKARFVLDG